MNQIDEESKVVINDEEQYSIWPAGRVNALGWHDAGFSGTNQACLEHINKVWTDMRPKSLRLEMAANETAGAAVTSRHPEGAQRP